MPRPKPTVPAYRRHKPSGQAIVTVVLNGTRKDVLSGPFVPPIPTRTTAGAPAGLTVSELGLQFWEHARTQYHPPDDGSTGGGLNSSRRALRVFRELCGDSPARAFGRPSSGSAR